MCGDPAGGGGDGGEGGKGRVPPHEGQCNGCDLEAVCPHTELNVRLRGARWCVAACFYTHIEHVHMYILWLHYKCCVYVRTCSCDVFVPP